MKKLLVFTLLFSAVLLAGSFWQELPAQTAAPVDILTTIAGGAARDGGLATDALTNSPRTVVFDSAGNLYFADSRNNRVRKVDAASGIITTVAGTGEVGFSGDGGPATLARLNRPVDIAFDSAGNLYTVELFNRRIRKIDAITGIITTVAGTGLLFPFNGDNIPATSANLFNPTGIALDSSDNLFIAVQNDNRIRKVDAVTQIITTVAGTGAFSSTGDGDPATSATFRSPGDIAFDSEGNFYIAEINGNRIRKVDAFSGIITAVAGNGTAGFSGDGGSATSATINLPSSVAVDAQNNLYITDTGNHRIRKVELSGVITTIAGTETAGFNGDGGPATSAQLNSPRAVGFDSAGNVYVGDSANHRVRKVDVSGTITTIAGSGVGDGFLATDAILIDPRNVVFDSVGNFYTADESLVRKISLFPPIITTVAGKSISGLGFSGDGGLATDAQLSGATDVEFDSLGNLYIADSRNHRIRKVDTSGIITTVAGTGAAGFSGDGGPATMADLQSPLGVAIDSADNLYIADLRNHRIRKVDTSGIITTVAGTGEAGFSGDGGPATSARLRFPFDVDIDSNDNLYVADGNNNRIRKVDTSGIITTVAGTGAAGFSGDGGPATSASIRRPFGVSVDGEDNLYIADNRNNRVRKVDASTGIISTIAGIGIPGESGDGGPAVNAEINAPSGVGIDDDGIVYISGSRRIRRVGPLLSLVDALTKIVTDLDLPAGLENSLISKLDTALKVLEDVNENNDVAAINALQAFINAVAAQRGKKISEVVADALIGEATLF